MDLNIFRNSCNRYFSSEPPTVSAVAKSDRLEVGWRVVLVVDGLCWRDMTREHADFIGGEIHWLANEWILYLLPAYMILSAEVVMADNYQKAVSDDLNGVNIYDVVFDSIREDQRTHLDVKWYSLSKKQVALIETWARFMRRESDVFSTFSEKAMSEVFKNISKR